MGDRPPAIAAVLPIRDSSTPSHATIAGPEGEPPPLVVTEALRIGVLRLGPRTCYPLHRPPGHPATELYLPRGAAECTPTHGW